MLNKKYAVDEISYTTRKEGLTGIQEIVADDYLYMFYCNIIFVLVLLIIFVAVSLEGVRGSKRYRGNPRC